MTMRRISLLLVGVVVAVMLSMGTALAHSSNNHKLCHVVKNGKDFTKTGLSHKEWKRELNRHHRDYAGKCENGNGGFKAQDIGKIAAGPF